MKATLDIPDDLYLSVKARSALERRTLRSVAVELFEKWLSAPPPAREEPSPDRKPTRFDKARWAKIARPYMRPGASHDLEDMRAAIAGGWAREAAGKMSHKP